MEFVFSIYANTPFIELHIPSVRRNVPSRRGKVSLLLRRHHYKWYVLYTLISAHSPSSANRHEYSNSWYAIPEDVY